MVTIAFTERNGKISRKQEYQACFASINVEKYTSIEYPAKIDSSLSKEAVKFYIRFLRQIFDKSKFRCKIDNNQVIWKMKYTTKWYKNEAIYLMAFRYTHEFPLIVKDLYKNRKEDIESNFKLFQELHNEHRVYSYNHTLVNPYRYNIISLEEFKQRCSKKINYVESVFQKVE